MSLYRFADMREVGFDLPLRNPQGVREPTSLPQTHPEQCDDLLSQCRFTVFHRPSSLHAKYVWLLLDSGVLHT